MSTQMILAISVSAALFLLSGGLWVTLIAIRLLAERVLHLETRVDELASDRK